MGCALGRSKNNNDHKKKNYNNIQLNSNKILNYSSTENSDDSIDSDELIISEPEPQHQRGPIYTYWDSSIPATPYYSHYYPHNQYYQYRTPYQPYYQYQPQYQDKPQY